MKTTALLISILAVGFSCFGQMANEPYPCEANDILDVGINVKGFKVIEEPLPHCEIPKDSIKNGFKLQTHDTSFEIVSFVVVYSNTQVVHEYLLKGSKASIQNAGFLKKVKVGDQLSIECISILKSGVRSLSTSLRIIVTE